MMYDWHDRGDWGIGNWVLMVLMMVALWGLVAGLIAYLVRGALRRPSLPGAASAAAPVDPAMRILEERFARGEIDAEELDARRRALRS